MPSLTTDVLIVGAGPVGLFLANELIRHGLTVSIIDKKTTLSTQSKALGIHIRSQEVFADSGFIKQIQAQGHPCSGMVFKHQDQVIAEVDFHHADARFHHVIDLPQDQTEAILQQGLLEKNNAVLWQTELVAINQQDNGVTATLQSATGPCTLNAAWLVACDGAHSTVRHLLELGFEGKAYDEHWWLADIDIEWAEARDKMIIYFSDNGPVACFPMQDQRYRLVMQAPTTGIDQPSFADIQQCFAAACPTHATLKNPRWISGFAIAHRQIHQYRHQRIFFAGDAAHIHSPMGGQGMNTGIQDAYNLAWKLALVQQQSAPEALLDSYHLERHLVGSQVLHETDRMTKAFTLKNPLAIHLRNQFMHFLTAFDAVQQKLVNTLSELRICYPASGITQQQGHFALQAGMLIPAVGLQDTSGALKNMFAICQGIQYHLFIFAGLNNILPSKVLQAIQTRLQANARIALHVIGAAPDGWLGTCWHDVDFSVHHLIGIKQASLMVVRPDKYIGLLQTPIDSDALMMYLAHTLCIS